MVPGATIQIQNVETGFSRTLQTDREGRYVARNLPLGSYSLTAQQAGFRTEVRRGIVLAVGSEVTVSLELSVGDVQERVEVTAELPAIETTTATLSGLVNPEQLRDLPLNARSYEHLALLAPGVITNRSAGFIASQGRGLRLAVNGARPDANLYLFDGTVVNDHSTHSPGSDARTNLGVEAIREFRVLTHNFSAEYGRNAGAVISAVTRSGTNEFHGSVYEFVRNNIFDARNFFNPGDLPPFRRNQFGASLGGPILRDRIFFFANYEGLRQRRGETVIATVPDANARQGLMPDPATGQLREVPFNPVVKPYLDLYPLPNGRNFGDGTAEYITDFSASATDDFSMQRMDFRLSDADSFYWRYIFNPSNAITSRAVPTFMDQEAGTNHFVVLGETHIFSGTSLTEFRLGFNRTTPAVDGFPVTALDPSLSFVPGQVFGTIRYSLSPTGAQLSELGTTRVAPQLFAQNLYQVTDTFSTVRGAHSLKFGGDLQNIRLNTSAASFVRGAYQFGSLGNLLAARPDRFDVLLQGGSSTRERSWRRVLFGWFIQDDLRLRSNLTLNLGFRHEFFTSPTDAHGRTGNMRNVTDPEVTLGPPFESPKANFAPRLGLAWDPTGSGRTSVRAGAGVFHNHMDGRSWYASANNNPLFLTSLTIRNAPFPNAYSLVAGVNPGLKRNDFVQFDADTPTMVHYNLDIQRELIPTVSLRVGYVGSYGYNLVRATSENIRVAQIRPDGSKFFAANAPVVNPNFADMRGSWTDAHSNYNALQVEVQRAVSSGLRLQASYTLAKAMADADTLSNQQTTSTAATTLDIHDLSRDYSRSAYDQRQTFVLNSRYPMPSDKRLNGRMTKAILGGWAINGIFSAGSGLPFNIQLGFNNAQNGDGDQPDRPNLAPGASTNPIEGVTAGCQGISAGQKLRTPDRYFDPCAFELPEAGTFGNLGRNTVTGPTFYNVDFTLVKSTPLSERMNLDFRAEFFNLFNHANFGIPIRAVFSSARTHSGNEGRITETITPGREIQFGLRLTF